ncbi:hypothetical protein [Sporosalibacterium faouarense]|uniref:hypothetical protein n=1 Tax=Sporosalibacterium faouarense TaxID=516123 RepID=UPI00192C43FC|nr:hypothetical protein [Sporosalibacterium faouarense]
MYRQFCKNLKNYLDINKSDSYRYRLGKEIEALSDIKLYNQLKESNKDEYFKIAILINEMSKLKEENSDIRKFIWELWAYGFELGGIDDSIRSNRDNDDDLHEKIKLVNLLLGTHYWN